MTAFPMSPEERKEAERLSADSVNRSCRLREFNEAGLRLEAAIIANLHKARLLQARAIMKLLSLQFDKNGHLGAVERG